MLAGNAVADKEVTARWRRGFIPRAARQHDRHRLKLIDDLGLRVVDGKITSAVHFWSEFNFTAANGKVIWRAP